MNGFSSFIKLNPRSVRLIESQFLKIQIVVHQHLRYIAL